MEKREQNKKVQPSWRILNDFHLSCHWIRISRFILFKWPTGNINENRLSFNGMLGFLKFFFSNRNHLNNALEWVKRKKKSLANNGK